MLRLPGSLKDRVRTSAFWLLGAGACLLLYRLALAWPYTRSAAGWLHDSVWRMIVGYAFYYFAPYSQVGFASLLLLLAAWWLAWLAQIPLFNLPQVLAAKAVLYSPLVQDLVLKTRSASVRTAMTKDSERGSKSATDVLIQVGEAQLRGEMVRLSEMEVGNHPSKSALPLNSSSARAVAQKWLFLARYYCPDFRFIDRQSLPELVAAAEALARAFILSDGKEEELRARFQQVTRVYYGRIVSEKRFEEGWPERFLTYSGRDFPSSFSRVPALLEILWRSRETRDGRELRPLDALLGRYLELCQQVHGLLWKFRVTGKQGPGLVALEGQIRHLTETNLYGMYLGRVMDLWLEVLFEVGRWGAVTYAGEVARQFSGHRLSFLLQTAHAVPWQEESKRSLNRFLIESRVAFPERVAFFAGRARRAAGKTVAASGDRSLQEPKAAGLFFESGNIEWITAIQPS